MMRTTIPFRILMLAAALVPAVLVPSPAVAQEEEPGRRASPVGIARTQIGDAYVKVTYGRPYVRGRLIFGPDTTALVPFGRVWRTGANEATEITLTRPLLVSGTPLEAGTYAMFTVPGPSSWAIHFSPQVGLDGTGRLDPATGDFTPDVYDPSRDVAIVRAPAMPMDRVVDPFTLEFEPTERGADLVLRWERTEVRVPFERPGR